MTEKKSAQTAMHPMFIRLAEKDREPVDFYLDGCSVSGFKGDTVLTAILTHQSSLRQTEKLNALRAGFCLMGACQDCWVELESGERLRACTSFLSQGVHIKTTLDVV